jgi:hypothetical protein
MIVKECEASFKKLSQTLSLDPQLSEQEKAKQIAESLRSKRMDQIRSNIGLLDNMIRYCFAVSIVSSVIKHGFIRVLESDEASLEDHESMLDLSQIQQRIDKSKSLFFSMPKVLL